MRTIFFALTAIALAFPALADDKKLSNSGLSNNGLSNQPALSSGSIAAGGLAGVGISGGAIRANTGVTTTMTPGANGQVAGRSEATSLSAGGQFTGNATLGSSGLTGNANAAVNSAAQLSGYAGSSMDGPGTASSKINGNAAGIGYAGGGLTGATGSATLR
jgi:hypothetical protein